MKDASDPAGRHWNAQQGMWHISTLVALRQVRLPKLCPMHEPRERIAHRHSSSMICSSTVRVAASSTTGWRAVPYQHAVQKGCVRQLTSSPVPCRLAGKPCQHAQSRQPAARGRRRAASAAAATHLAVLADQSDAASQLGAAASTAGGDAAVLGNMAQDAGSCSGLGCAQVGHVIWKSFSD